MRFCEFFDSLIILAFLIFILNAAIMDFNSQVNSLFQVNVNSCYALWSESLTWHKLLPKNTTIKINQKLFFTW